MHWEPMTLSAIEQDFMDMQEETRKQIMSIYGISAHDIEAVKAAYEQQEKRETFDYKPGFKWLEFRVGHNYYAQQSDWMTQTLMRVSNHL